MLKEGSRERSASNSSLTSSSNTGGSPTFEGTGGQSSKAAVEGLVQK